MTESRRHAPRVDDAFSTTSLAVGVTGHRRLGSVIESNVEHTVPDILADIEQIADEVSARYPRSKDTSTLQITSSLAEGADRLVARIAVDRGWRLCAPLPFRRNEYERDFPNSVNEFRSLLACAKKTGLVIELDGTRAQSGNAYLQAGRIMLEHSDVLIAVWDGKIANGEGGTGQIVEEARRRGVIVIHFAADAIRPCQLLVGMENATSYSRSNLESHIRRSIDRSEAICERKHD
jgi:hypothetical protein